MVNSLCALGGIDAGNGGRRFVLPVKSRTESWRKPGKGAKVVEKQIEVIKYVEKKKAALTLFRSRPNAGRDDLLSSCTPANCNVCYVYPPAGQKVALGVGESQLM